MGFMAGDYNRFEAPKGVRKREDGKHEPVYANEAEATVTVRDGNNTFTWQGNAEDLHMIHVDGTLSIMVPAEGFYRPPVEGRPNQWKRERAQ